MLVYLNLLEYMVVFNNEISHKHYCDMRHLYKLLIRHSLNMSVVGEYITIWVLIDSFSLKLVVTVNAEFICIAFVK